MATLFNTKISATYPGLLKTIDNAALSATLRELTDGAGNLSGLFLNTAGDFKVTNILEWGSLKDTGTGVTITQWVTAANGIENFDNDTTVPTSAAVKLYVDSKFATSDTLEEVLSFGNTTGANNIVIQKSIQLPTTTTNNGTPTDVGVISFGGTFSNGNRIFNDATGGNLRIQGTDNLQLFAPNHKISNVNGSLIIAGDTGVKLFYQNSQKLQTTTSGIDVTGNLVVSGSITGAGGSFLPLAGGTMTGNIVLNDNVKSIYGTSSDGLEIYHDGSNSYISDTGTGDLYIQGSDDIYITSASGEKFITCNTNDSVEVRFDNSIKLTTTSTGVSITGQAVVSNGIDVNGGNVDLIDNVRLRLGTASDLQIYHDGSNSFISDLGTGSLILTGANDIALKSDTNERFILANKNSSVDLFYDNILRLETVTDGAKVTGNLEVTGTITGAGGSFLPLIGGTMTGDTIHNDNVKSIYGTSSDGLEITHDGSNSLVSDTGTGGLFLQANSEMRFRKNGTSEIMAQFLADAEVRLYYNNSKKFETTSGGISVTGAGNFTGNVSVPDTKFLQAGSSGDVIIGHDGSNSTFRNSTGDLNIEQFAVTKSIFFKVSDANAGDVTALTISRNGDLTTGRDVTIAGDLTVNGTTTTVNSQTLAVVDPLIQLAKDNTANSLDIGLYGDYNDGTDRFLGLFSDASDGNKFKLFKGLTVEPTTTVNIGGAGYAAADLVLAGLVAEEDIEIRSGNKLILQRPNNAVATEISTDVNGTMILNSPNSEGFKLQNNGTDLLEIGNVSLTGANFAGNVSLLDNKKAIFGAGNDLQIYHDGTNSFIETSTSSTGDLYIKAQGTGHELVLQATDDILIRPQGGNNGIKVIGQASVELYYNNVLKFETTSTGIDVSGTSSTFAGKLGIGVAASNQLTVNSGTQSDIVTFQNDNGSMVFGQTAGLTSLDLATGNSLRIRQGSVIPLSINGSGDSTFSGTASAFTVIARDNLFMGVGQFYLGAETGTVDETYRQRVSSGSFFIESRESGTWTNRLQINTAGTLIVQQGATIGSLLSLPEISVQNQINTTSANLEFNFKNGDGTTTNYKDFYVRDGKNGVVLQLQGSSKDATFAGNINISSPGDLYINSGTSYNNTGSIFLSNQRSEISSVIVDGTANGDTALNFKTRRTGNTASALYIDEFRNIGIQTTNPQSQLHINQDASNSYAGLRLEGSNRGGIIEMYNGTYPVSKIQTDQSGNIGIYTSGAFASSTLTEKFAILTNGSVYNGLASNTHFGLNALSSVTTADESTAFGNFALRAQQSGRNTAVGYHTLQDLTTGNYNTVVGGEAGENITVGQFNVGMGSFALRNATDISNVTAIGYKALYDLTTGGSNTAVGGSAGENLTTGGSNTLIGANAGDSMTDGDSNVVIGRLAYQAGSNDNNTVVGMQAGYNANQSNAVIIGYRAGWTNNGSSNVFVGAESGRNNTSGYGNCFIGTDAGYAVTTGAQNSFVGIGAGTYQTGSYNTSLGRQSMFGVSNASSGSYNTGVGYYAGFGNKGENNTCLGAIAGRYMDTGQRNTIVGSQACDNNAITGDDNVVMGFAAGQNITSGYSNTLMGGNAGRLLLSAFENTYIGYHSGYNATGGNYNTALGVYSLREATSADRCTAIGRSALINNTTGDFNTALGMSAGESNSSGSNNVFLGYNSGTLHETGSNTVIIGSSAQPSSTSASNEITLGNSSIGALRCQVTSITSLSDKRDKTNIKDSDYGLDVINSLRPVTFDWNHRDESENKGKKDVGFIAQELQKIDDESLRLVYSENPEKLEATYGRLIPVMVKAIQELTAKVEMLENNCQCKN